MLWIMMLLLINVSINVIKFKVSIIEYFSLFIKLMSDNNSEMPEVVQSVLLLLYIKFPNFTAEQLFQGMLQVMNEIVAGRLTFRTIRFCTFANDKNELYFNYDNIPEYYSDDDEDDPKNNGCCSDSSDSISSESYESGSY